MFAEHVYSAPGTQDVSVCVSDDIAEDCITDRVFVEHLVNLGITISDDPDETTGSFIDLDIEVENMEPQGIPGVIRRQRRADPDQRKKYRKSPSPVHRLPVRCLLTAQTARFPAATDLMTPGETFNATVRVRRTETVAADLRPGRTSGGGCDHRVGCVAGGLHAGPVGHVPRGSDGYGRGWDDGCIRADLWAGCEFQRGCRLWTRDGDGLTNLTGIRAAGQSAAHRHRWGWD